MRWKAGDLGFVGSTDRCTKNGPKYFGEKEPSASVIGSRNPKSSCLEAGHFSCACCNASVGNSTASHMVHQQVLTFRLGPHHPHPYVEAYERR